MPSRMESSARRRQRAKSNGLSCPQLYTATELVAPNLGLKTSIQTIHIFPNYWSLLWSELVRTHLYHLEPQVLLCHKPRFPVAITSECSKWQGLAGYCQVSQTCDPRWGLRPLRVHEVDKNSHHVKFSLVDEPHRLQDSEVTRDHTPISIYLQGWVSKFCNHHRWNNWDINPLSEKWWPPALGILGKETCTTCFTSHQIHQTTTNNNRVVTSDDIWTGDDMSFNEGIGFSSAISCRHQALRARPRPIVTRTTSGLCPPPFLSQDVLVDVEGAMEDGSPDTWKIHVAENNPW